MLLSSDGPQTHERGERHAVYVAAGRGFRGIDVGVGVDPDQADRLVLSAVELGDAGDRAGCHGMIPAKRQWDFPGLERLDHELRMFRAGGGDLFQIFGVRVAFFFLLGNGDGDVATVFDLVPESFQPRFEAGYAYGRGAHVDSSARLAEIKRNADDTNFPGRDVGRAGRCCHRI